MGGWTGRFWLASSKHPHAERWAYDTRGGRPVLTYILLDFRQCSFQDVLVVKFSNLDVRQLHFHVLQQQAARAGHQRVSGYHHAHGEEALGRPSHFKATRSVNYLVEVTQNFGNDLLHISFIQERHDEAEGRILGEAVV